MPTYQQLALRTLADPSVVLARINETEINEIINLVARAKQIGLQFDRFKRRVFYGKGDIIPPVTPEKFLVNAVANLDAQKVNILHSGIGQLTEACEFLESILGTIALGEPLDTVNLAEEIGDGQWYHAIGCEALGTEMEVVQQANIAKLTQRYPEKFNEEQAINRDLDKERAILEKH